MNFTGRCSWSAAHRVDQSVVERFAGVEVAISAWERPSCRRRAMRSATSCRPGSALAARCPHCGAEVPPDFRFCGHCGKGLQEMPAPAVLERSVYTPKHLADKILHSRSALEGERRQVTVLFADVAGFTSLAEK